MEYRIPKPYMADPVYKAGKLVGYISTSDWDIWFSRIANAMGLKFGVTMISEDQKKTVRCFIYWRIASSDEREYDVKDRWEHLGNIGETKLESSISVPPKS